MPPSDHTGIDRSPPEPSEADRADQVHRRRCSICQNVRRAEIKAAYLAWEPVRAIAVAFDVRPLDVRMCAAFRGWVEIAHRDVDPSTLAKLGHVAVRLRDQASKERRQRQRDLDDEAHAQADASEEDDEGWEAGIE